MAGCFQSNISEEALSFLQDKRVPQLMEHMLRALHAPALAHGNHRAHALELIVQTPADPIAFLVDLLQ
eukprot:gene6657-1190_t